jgi:hypothetical protein
MFVVHKVLREDPILQERVVIACQQKPTFI